MSLSLRPVTQEDYEVIASWIAKAEAFPGTKRVRLFVYRDNSSAIRLYSRLGFAQAATDAGPEMLALDKQLRQE